jgi:hypothetical protein
MTADPHGNSMNDLMMRLLLDVMHCKRWITYEICISSSSIQHGTPINIMGMDSPGVSTTLGGVCLE